MTTPAAEGPRFSEWSATNHQAPLWITTILSLVYSCAFLCVRIAVKIRRLALDDAILGVAYLISFAQWAIIFTALHRGVGKSTDTQSPENPAKLIFATTPLTLLAIGLTKCSIVSFLRMVFTRENKKAWRSCNILLVIVAVWTVASTLIITVGCSPKEALDTGRASQCSSEEARWAIVTGIDSFLEIILVLLAAYLLSSLHMRVKTKLTVISAFSFRLGVPALFIAYLTLHTSFRTHGTPNLSSTNFLVLQQTLLAYSLMAATVPCLRGFLGRFRTGDLARLFESSMMESDVLREWASRSRSRPRGSRANYALSSMDPAVPGRIQRAKKQVEEFLGTEGMADRNATRAWAERDGGKSRKSAGGYEGSEGSDKMIIHQTMDVDVVR